MCDHSCIYSDNHFQVSTLTNRNENNGSKKIKSQVTYFFMFFFRKQQQQSHTKYINVYQFRMESESQYS